MTDLTDLLSLIPRMMHNPMGERFVRAGLVTGGWKREDVDAAFAARAAQAQVEVPARGAPDGGHRTHGAKYGG